MRGAIGDRARLESVLGYMSEVEQALSGHDCGEFVNNKVLKTATVKLLEIIGELCGRVTEQTKKEFPAIEWQALIGLSTIAPEYYQIDYEVIWESAAVRLPKLKEEIQSIKLDGKDEILNN